MMDSIGLKTKHRDSLVQMLNFNKPVEELGRSDWKVLVYDEACRDIISPLLNVGDLRKQGVTLFLLLTDPKREAVPDVSAIYFVAPTEHNVARIAKDIGEQLYDSFHINFSSAVPRSLLERLATLTLETDSVRLVSKIHDHCANFVSLENTCFTLNMPKTYADLHSRTVKDTQIEAVINDVVMGIFGVIATLGVIPVIRAQPGGPAEMVANKLNASIQEHLENRTGMLGGDRDQKFSRPVLVILDRSVDLPVMLHHPWTYQAIVADTLETRLNHITIETEKQGKMTKKTFDVDSSDPFWAENASRIFPEAIAEVDTLTKQYKKDMEEMNQRTAVDAGLQDANTDATLDLGAAMSLLPEMQDRKRRLDTHTDVGVAILNKVKEREIHSFHKLEKEILKRNAVDMAQLRACLVEPGHGKLEDRVRLLLSYFLCTDDSAQEAIAEFEAALSAAGADLSAMRYLKDMKALNSMTSAAGNTTQSSSGQSWLSSLGMDRVGSQLHSAVKNLIPVGDQLPITRLVSGIMGVGSTAESETFAYFDPKARKGSSARVTAAPSDAIVFVVGGGSYAEYQNLQDHLGNNSQAGKTIVYGSTGICNAETFLSQLTELGGQFAQ